MKKIAALFVATDGPYFGLKDIEPWDEIKDARKYSGPHKVIAHPPCERWGRYWSGGPNPRARRFRLGDDGGCFSSAIASVRKFGGVLEHPEASHAWRTFGLAKPPKNGGWIRADKHGWTCCVEQGHYGHPARKATWLYCVQKHKPKDLIWGRSSGMRMDEGFHSKEHRKKARAAGQKPIKRLSKTDRVHSPAGFVNLLIELVTEPTPACADAQRNGGDES